MGFFDNLLNKTREKVYNSQFAQNLRNKWNAPTTQAEHPWLSGANSFLQGMSSGVVGGTGIDKVVSNKLGFNALNNFQPESNMDKILSGAGYGAGIVASPISKIMSPGASTLQRTISTGRNMASGGLFGGLASMAGDVISGEDITLQKTLEGAKQGAKYSWLYPYTTSATDKAMVAAANKFPSVAKYLAPVTEAGLKTAQNAMTTAGTQGARAFLPKAASFVAKNTLRQGIESPLETAAFAGMDTLGNDKSYAENYGDRALQDLLGNLAFGGITSGAKAVGAGYGGIKNFNPDAPVKTEPKKIFQTTDEMLKSKEFAKEEARIATEKKKVAELTDLKPEQVDQLYKIEPDPLKIVTEVRKARGAQEPTAIGDILSNRKVTVDPTIKSEADFKKKQLISKTGLSEIFVNNKLNEGYTHEQIASAYNYAKESPTPVKSMEGYITKSLRTKNFSSPEVKPVKTEDRGYLESLLQTEPGKKVSSIVEPTKTAVETTTQPQPEVKTYKYDRNRVEKDIELLGKVSKKVETPENKAQALKFVESFGKGLDEELTARGVKFSDFIDQVESGKVDPTLDDLGKATKKFFDTMADVGAERNKQIPLERKNYFHRVSEDMINNRKEPTLGDVLFQASYTKERTGKLTDYVKDYRSFVDYAEQAIGATTKAEQARVRIANEINNEAKDLVSKETKDDRNLFEKTSDKVTSSLSITRKIKEAQDRGEIPTPEKKVVYDAPDKKPLFKAIESLFTSTNELADKAGSQFYDNFLLPFRQVGSRVNEYSSAIAKLPEDRLKSEYQKQLGRIKPDMTSEDMIARLTFNMHKKLTASATNTFTKNIEEADFKQTSLKDLADQIFNEYVVTDIKAPKTAEKIMGFIRAQTGRGALGLNVASAANNILEIRRIIASVDAKSFEKGFARAQKEDFSKKYGVDSARSTALERMYSQRSKISQTMEKVDKGLFYMFDKSESYKDNIMLASLEEQGKTKGLTGKELEKFVFKKFDQYAIKYGKGNDIGLFKNKAVKTIFQFAQYPIKDAKLFIDKTAGMLGGDKGDRKYFMKYALSSIAQMLAFQATMGVIGFGDKSGTPYDFFKDIKDGKIPFSPIMTLAFQLGQNAVGAVNGEDTSTYEYEKRQNDLNKNAMIVSVPASNQLFNKTGAYLESRNKGYYETKYGKNKGAVANPVGTGVGDTIKGTLFGPSYDSKRQEYFDQYDKGITPSLTANESAVYKTLTKDEKAKFYKKSQESEMRRKEREDIKAGIPTKTGFFDKVLGKKKEVKSFIPDKDSTPQEWKDFRSDYDTKIATGVYEPTPEETKARYFRDKSGDTKDLKEKVAVYKTIDSVMDNEDITDTVKQQVLEASGATKEDIEYYRKASEADQTRLQEMLPTLEKASHEDMLTMLMKSRKSVADKVLVTNGMIDYLYENDHISENEKEMLKAIQYDEITGKYYIKKSFSKQGEGKKLTFAQAKKIFNFDSLNIKTSKTISQLLGTNGSSTGNNRLIEEILGTKGYTPKVSGKKLWFKPY